MARKDRVVGDLRAKIQEPARLANRNGLGKKFRSKVSP